MFDMQAQRMTHLTLAKIPDRRSFYSQRTSCTFVPALRGTLYILLLLLVHSARCEDARDQPTVSVSPPPNLSPLQHAKECQSTVKTGSTSNSQLTVSKLTLKLWLNDLHHGVWHRLAIITSLAFLASHDPVDASRKTKIINRCTTGVDASVSKSIWSACDILKARVGCFQRAVCN